MAISDFDDGSGKSRKHRPKPPINSAHHTPPPGIHGQPAPGLPEPQRLERDKLVDLLTALRFKHCDGWAIEQMGFVIRAFCQIRLIKDAVDEAVKENPERGKLLKLIWFVSSLGMEFILLDAEKYPPQQGKIECVLPLEVDDAIQSVAEQVIRMAQVRNQSSEEDRDDRGLTLSLTVASSEIIHEFGDAIAKRVLRILGWPEETEESNPE